MFDMNKRFLSPDVADAAAATKQGSAPAKFSTPLGDMNPASGNDLRACLTQVENGLSMARITDSEFEAAQRLVARGDRKEWELLMNRQKEGTDLVAAFGPCVAQFNESARFHVPEIKDEAGNSLVVTRNSLFGLVFRSDSKVRTAFRKLIRTYQKI